jgi:predicted nucleotide-binding protein
MANTILFVDDNPYYAYPFIAAVESDGFEVMRASSADEALERCGATTFSAVVLDVMMAPGSQMGTIETRGGFQTGMVLARQIRRLQPSVKLVALTASQDPEVTSFFKKDGSVAYFLRQNTEPYDLSSFLKSFVVGSRRSPRTFIVHGRDKELLFELKNFLQNNLRFEEPTVLFEKPSHGRTVIEKFEHHSSRVDLAFVLMTPDDVGRLAASSPTEDQFRARLNVVFEYGYFFGLLGRQSGKVLLLHKGKLELPSDIFGIVYIDVTHGIGAAEGSIRKELAEWL